MPAIGAAQRRAQTKAALGKVQPVAHRSADAVEDATAAPVLEPIDDAVLADLGWVSAPPGGDHTYALREAGRIVGVVALDLRAVLSEEFGRCATIVSAGAPQAANPDGCREAFEFARRRRDSFVASLDAVSPQPMPMDERRA